MRYNERTKVRDRIFQVNRRDSLAFSMAIETLTSRTSCFIFSSSWRLDGNQSNPFSESSLYCYKDQQIWRTEDLPNFNCSFLFLFHNVGNVRVGSSFRDKGGSF